MNINLIEYFYEMKKLMSLIAVSLCFACADDAKTTESINTSEETVQKNSSEKEVASSAVVSTVDFEAFDSKYLQKKNDTTYVINFWATWCKPCVEELPAFEKLNKQLASKKVKVVLASLDFPDKIEQQVIPFMKENNLKSEVVLLDDPDANSWIPKVSEEWSGAIPATIILNQQERKFYERTFTYEELNTELQSFL
ncbi:TlpA disulfide reductase family protein [Zunongwangia sp. F260]|uniref:TlpA disulfide reductase family protein n=1 Tax=Autumnicola lenta TaxID=3075593 RepID=A0ABU3CJQ1_9FLAO|nr:TlpA disulfide reductase family protein [Zunongwangia sp. F260]MDT0646574.1 TlpA disulfide reductase family protein [Zunongwangia sp. F260]